jgi:DNA-binding PadR family transcriptional regulator
MGDKDYLGEFEQVVLLAVLRAGEDAYAVTIREEIARRTGRNVSRGALYITLERLEEKGYLRSRLGGATPERGGRPKRFYRVQPSGVTALEASREALERMWRGVPKFKIQDTKF